MSPRSRLALDAGLFVALLVAYYPARTGIVIHEWLSIAVVVPLLVHLLVNWDWTVRVAARFVDRLLSASRLNLVVDVVLFVWAVALMLSGLMVSQAISALFAWQLSPNAIWYGLHSVAADATVLLLLVHLGLHWRWVARVLGVRLGVRPPTSAPVRAIGTASDSDSVHHGG